MRRILSVGVIAFFLVTAQGAATTAFAADWELWPRGRGKATPEGTPVPQQKEEESKKPAAPPPGETAKPSEAAAAAKEGKEAGKAVEAGVSSGTIGKAAAITAGLVAIGIAVGGGGGTTTTVHH